MPPGKARPRWLRFVYRFAASSPRNGLIASTSAPPTLDALGERLVKARMPAQGSLQRMLKRLLVSLTLILGLAAPAMAAGSVSDTFSANEIVKTGGEFFGSVSQGLA